MKQNQGMYETAGKRAGKHGRQQENGHLVPVTGEECFLWHWGEAVCWETGSTGEASVEKKRIDVESTETEGQPGNSERTN